VVGTSIARGAGAGVSVYRAPWMLPTAVLVPPLVLPYCSFTLPFTVWIMKAYFETVHARAAGPDLPEVHGAGADRGSVKG